MAEFAISGLNVIASDGADTAQMGIRRLTWDLVRCRRFGSRAYTSRVVRGAPQEGTTPIVGVAVVPVVFGFMLSGNRLMRVDVGAILNVFFRQRHIQTLGFPIRIDHCKWRDQHLPSAQPAAGVHSEIADGPALILQIDLIYRS